MARALSPHAEDTLRSILGDTPETEKLIHDIAVWEPKPPRSLAVTGKIAPLSEHAKETLRKWNGEEAGNKLIADWEAWNDDFNAKRAGRALTEWTPERMKAYDSSAAERARRYRARQRAAKQAMKAQNDAPDAT